MAKQQVSAGHKVTLPSGEVVVFDEEAAALYNRFLRLPTERLTKRTISLWPEGTDTGRRGNRVSVSLAALRRAIEGTHHKRVKPGQVVEVLGKRYRLDDSSASAFNRLAEMVEGSDLSLHLYRQDGEGGDFVSFEALYNAVPEQQSQ